jgi:predicted ATPase/DNA-binding CsgD family transcriptional regulator
VEAQALPASNLPVQLTSFVGREPELVALAAALRQDRLVTIAGASGLGKTRLALELARRTLPEHLDGAWFVSLVALTDPSQVLREVATTVGVREQFDGPVLPALTERIGEHAVLLVLDNCEHLVDACARLVESLLRECPGLRVLATAHEPLRVPGEHLWRIAPLGLPVVDNGQTSFQALVSSEAVRLFQARASLVQPHFALTAANAMTVARLCQRLDGIPLAIELAAARAEMMSVDDILARLEDRFRLLAGGSRTALPRHQTLRAALDWGHQLLNEDERRLFRRLSVFAGPFDLEAAERVGAGPDLPAESVVGHLGRLVDKSMIVPAGSSAGRTRCRALETVRMYAAERLAEAGEGDDIRRRHAAHFLALAEEGSRFERRPGQEEWLERLDADHDDLRAALQWCRAHDHASWERLALALAWFWLLRGHMSEGREWLQGLVALPALSPGGRAWVLFWLARMAFWQTEYGVASELGEASLTAFRRLGDQRGAGWMLNVLGSIYTYSGEAQRSAACLEEALTAAAGDVELRIDSLISLGELRLVLGDIPGARSRLEEALDEAGGPESRWLVANGALFLAIAEYFDRQLGPARRHLEQALDVYHQSGIRHHLSAALYAAAALALAEGAPERALRLYAAAVSMQDTIRAPLAPGWQDLARTVVVEPSRAMVGAERADAALLEGSRMSVEEAVAEARETREPAAGDGDDHGWGPLSRREREVALLVASGLTNRQIADQLVIAERTVEGHLERIRGKLGLRSRTQIAVWVVARR